MPERRREFETEFNAIFRRTTPQAFCQCHSVDAQRHSWKRVVALSERCVNEMKHIESRVRFLKPRPCGPHVGMRPEARCQVRTENNAAPSEELWPVRT